MIILWLSLVFFTVFVGIFQRCLPLSILFAYHASGKMLKNAVGWCSSIVGRFSLACRKIMMIIRMIYVDENHDEYEDEFDDYDEEEDVWAYSGNFLWRALTIQAWLYHLHFIPFHLFLHFRLPNCLEIPISYSTLLCTLYHKFFSPFFLLLIF